jgi:hypothetical protein
MNQDKKKIIKAHLDNILKPLGIKYSLRVRDYMSIDCTLRSGPVDFYDNFKAKTGNQFDQHIRNHIQVNPYWYQEHFTGDCRDIIGRVVDALKSANYYDNSDAMIDYFDTAYYYHLNVGDWEKPYKIVAKQ